MRRLTVLTLLPTGCQAVTGKRIKWRANERRCAPLTVITLWKSHFIPLSCINVLNQLASLAWPCAWQELIVYFIFSVLHQQMSFTQKSPHQYCWQAAKKNIENKYGRENECGCIQPHTRLHLQWQAWRVIWVYNTVRHLHGNTQTKQQEHVFKKHMFKKTWHRTHSDFENMVKRKRDISQVKNKLEKQRLKNVKNAQLTIQRYKNPFSIPPVWSLQEPLSESHCWIKV